MLTASEKIAVLVEEKKERRSEISIMQQGLQNAVLALLLFLGTAIGLYASPEVIQNSFVQQTLLIGATQIVYFLSLYALVHAEGLHAQAEYVRAIEEKINLLAQDPLVVWESVGSEIMRRGPIAVAYPLMGGIVLLGWCWMLYSQIMEFSQWPLFTVVLGGELLIMATLVGLGQLRRGRVFRGVKVGLGLPQDAPGAELAPADLPSDAPSKG